MSLSRMSQRVASLKRQRGFIRLPTWIAQWGSKPFDPRSLFASGAQGAWYDPSNLGSMYQDSAGTTPVTAVGQPVGLRLDMRFGGARGAELNPSPSSTTGWTGYVGSIADVGGAIQITTSGANGGMFRNITTVVDQWYEVTAVVDKGTSNVASLKGNNSALMSTVLAGTQTLRGAFKATGVSSSINVELGNAGVGTAQGISIKPLPGNHATQSTSTSRPTLQQDAGGRWYGSDDGVDDSVAAATGGGGSAGFFFCAAIYVGGGAGTIRTLFDDHGTNTGYIVSINTANVLRLMAGTGSGFTIHTSTAQLPVGETHIVTAWDDGTNLKVQVDQGPVVSTARPVVAAGTAGFTLCKSNAGAAEFFPGRDYGMVYRKDSAPTATEIARTQRYLAARAGITL